MVKRPEEMGAAAAVRGRGVVLYGSLSIVRSFALAGIPVHVVDSSPDSLTPLSRYVRSAHPIACPRTEPDRAVDDLIAVAKRLGGRRMLAYDNDAMLLLVSRARDALSPYYDFVLPDADLVEDMVCKIRFARVAERLDLPTPRTIIPPSHMAADDIVDAIGLPCILKPDTHVGRFRKLVEQNHGRPHKVFRAQTLEDVDRTIHLIREYCDTFIVQQCVEGNDDHLYSFHAYYTRAGKLAGCYVGQKVRTYPPITGFSTYLKLIRSPELMQLGMSIMERLACVGPMKLDFKKDARTGKYLLLECNPRLNLWHILGARSGINLPAMAYADVQGHSLPPMTDYRDGLHWLSFGNDLRAFVRDYRRDRSLNWPGYLWSLRHRKVHEVFSWRDPKPFIVDASRFLAANCRKLTRRVGPRAVTTGSDQTLETATVGGSDEVRSNL